MSEWSPEPSDASSEGEHDTRVARIMTASPVRLRLVATPHPRRPEGHVVFRALAAIEGEVSDESPLLAQGSLPQATFDALQQVGLFDAAVPLLLTAQEDDGGVRAVLAALVPARDVERMERAKRAADEPWLASVADEADIAHLGAGSDDDAVQYVPFALGVILRFREDRKHPHALDDEALDLLATLLSGQAMDADRKRVENLLKSL